MVLFFRQILGGQISRIKYVIYVDINAFYPSCFGYSIRVSFKHICLFSFRDMSNGFR